MQLIETTGEGKSAVATPDGKSRKKKKKNNRVTVYVTLIFDVFLLLHFYNINN